MSTFTIANAAGSAGKTTTAVALAAVLAGMGRTVRLIDLDPQGNATHAVGVTPAAGQPTVAELLTGDADVAAVQVPTAWSRLSVLPVTPATLEGIETRLSRMVGAEQRLRLALEDAQPVDDTLIDCPGSIGLLTVEALVAADSAVTVAMPTVKELAGLPRIDQVVEQVRAAYRPKLRLAAVVPCKVPTASRGRLYADAVHLLTEQWGELVTPTVRDSVRVPEAYAARTPLPIYDPAAPVTGDYRLVADWLARAGVTT